ncbi:MAG: NADH-quinone oxidoreductase subunit C [Anaerolineaceae bacterium]|nr:NADH-quinone oxidoreductase subunit C [Anaerolineaceae bacterium]
MSEHLQNTLTSMQSRHEVLVEEFRGEFTLFVKPENIQMILLELRDQFSFNVCMDVTAVDYYPQETPRFHVIYQMYSMPNNIRLQVRTRLDGNSPRIDSVQHIFASANWKEREVFDLFGIHFTGHPDLRRMVMPQDWVGHPLRKDYPLGYEEVQFTFNFDEIMINKPHPKD